MRQKASAGGVLREVSASWTHRPGEMKLDSKSIRTRLKEFRLLWCTLAALAFVLFVWHMDATPNRQAGFLAVPAMSVTVQDGSKTQVIDTYARTVGELLSHQGIKLNKEDIVEPGSKIKLQNDMQVAVTRNMRLTLLADGQSKQVVLPVGSTVQQALTAAGIVINDLDQCSQPLTDTLLADSTVQLFRITSEVLEETTRTAFKTIEKTTDKLTKGVTKVTREGITGKVVTRTVVYFRDGEEIDRQEMETVVLREPVSEVVEVGTAAPKVVVAKATAKSDAKPNTSQSTPESTKKPDTSATDAKIQTLQKDGTEFQYSKELSMMVTAYTHTGRTTATGLWPKRGLVAVNTNDIPLGTKLYVEGYGFCYAEDTGVKTGCVDVFLETLDECKHWGRRRNVKVYIVKE